ncbi:hypothetical protein KGF56_001810 [Candida oxycetoniae]|uniref:Uncharacterized protein n=1 Tax=Candida oxycetoniae TaxID=497107 RepID=A0AAI9WYP7_9ASCO|nr:uncharacterized protein KGF56_001810 [Candida oxycetoniae]KAI3405363.1 hypothetical protein KGF56_001810 [Candida oxycetoniae]
MADTTNTTPLGILSPCDSCFTLRPVNQPQQYNPDYVICYLQARLAGEGAATNTRVYINDENDENDETRANETRARSNTVTSNRSQNEDHIEITIIYNHHDINIKLSSILSLINSHSINKVTSEELTINHLFLYLFYHQFVLFQQTFMIHQLSLIHLGRLYKFKFNTITTNKNMEQSLLKDLKINEFPKFLLNIKANPDGTTAADSHIISRSTYKKEANEFLDVVGFLKRYQNFKDQSTGNVTYVDALKMRLRRKNSADTNRSLLSRTSNSSGTTTTTESVENPRMKPSAKHNIKRRKLKNGLVRILKSICV